MSATALVRYLAPEWRHTNDIPKIDGWESMNEQTVAHQVAVHDARDIACDVETTGFQLVEHTPSVTDFRDEHAVTATYLTELSTVVTTLTGADHVFATHHFIRWGEPGDFEHGYAGFLHGDKPLNDPVGYSWERLARLGVELDGSDWDFAWYNTWQPIDRPAIRNPLTLIDARTVADGDIRLYCYDGAGELNLESAPVANPEHRFYYFPNLGTSELILFKQLETRPGHTPTCLHSAFEAPAPADAPMRRSIEVRWLAAINRRAGMR